MVDAWRRWRFCFAGALVGISALGCTSSRPPPAKTSGERPTVVGALLPSGAAASNEPAPAGDEARTGSHDSLGFGEMLAALRPPGARVALQALQNAPSDAEAYAQAALAYAATDVPGMTLLWGLIYQGLGGGASDVALAAALRRVLTERITAARREHDEQVDFHLRLAPGQMPLRGEPDGSVHAPVAHAFESLWGPTVTGFRPPWSVVQFYDMLSIWTGLVATRGTPLDDRLPLNGWLVTLAKAGHLEAFCYALVGPAFPAEFNAYKASNAAELKAYRDYVKAAPLRMTLAVMPDDLVRIK